jgi:UDP-3-O-[3-hydroxymyristoyl] glucosamine N-acyltransferase
MASKLFSPFYNDINNNGIHSTAIVSSDAKIGNNVFIGANVYIGPNCVIGHNSCIQPNVSLVCNVKLGSNCNIFPGTVLGSDGFGYAPTKNGYVKIEQLGSLVIGDNVEIGAGCTIDRGALDDTIIHDGVKLDNQIHIAHNVDLGKNSAIAACCAIAGSTVIGENFRMGGLSGVLGHLSITDNVSVGAHTLITKNISEGGEYIGIMPAQNPKDWAKSSIFIKKRK